MNNKPGILIVDDKLDNFKIIEHMLKDLDAEIIRAKSGEDALEKIKQHDFAIALVDFYMPGLDGFETIKQIHNYEKTKDLPAIIVTTQSPDTEIITRSIAAGAVDYITKPLIRAVIKGKVSIFLELYKKNKLIEENQKRYHKIIKTITDFTYTVKISNGKAIETIHGENYNYITGYNTEDFYKDSALWFKIIHEEDKSFVLEYTKKAITEKENLIFEHRIVKKNGDIRWVKSSIIQNFNEKGELESYDGILKDITERVESQKQIEELSRYPKENPNPVLRINSTGIILFSNEGGTLFKKMWCPTSSETISREILELITIVLKNGKQEELEVKINGKTFLFLFSPIVDMNYVNVYGTDITSLKKTEKELIELKNSLQKKVERRTEELAVTIDQLKSSNKEIKLQNKELEITYNELKTNESLMKIISENFPNSYLYVIDKNMITIYAGGQEFRKQNLNPKNFENIGISDIYKTYDKNILKIINKNYKKVFKGEKRNFELIVGEQFQKYNVIPLFDKNGKINNILSVIENMTEHWLSEIKLLDSKTKYKTLFNNISDSIFIYKIGKNFTEVNDSACKHLGYSKNELLTMSLKDIENSTLKSTKDRLKILTKNKFTIFETKHITKNGSIIPMEIKSHIIEYDKEEMVISVARDITERKKSEEEYRKLSEINFSLIQAIPDTMIRINRKNEIVSFITSESLNHIFKDKKTFGETIKNIIPEDTIQLVLITLNNVFKTGKPLTFDYIYHHNDKTLYIEVRLVISGEDNILMLLRDITEQKIFEKDLIESENKLRIVTASAPDSIIMIDNNGIITFWNKMAVIIFGYSNEEAIGKDIHKLLSPKRYKKDIAKGFSKFQKTGKGSVINSTVNLFGIHKDGYEIPIELSLSSLKINNEWHAIGVVRDITERIESEKERTRLATVIKQMNETVVITNPNGNIEYVNPFFEEKTGYTASETIGKTPSIIKSDMQDKKFYKDLWETIKSGKTWKGIFINKKKDGTLFHEEAIIFPVKDKSGEIINYASVRRDITERVITEQELLKAKIKAEESNIAKSNFLANMSHEIRTPMNSILGFTDMLKRTELNKNQTEYIDYVENSSKGLLTIINDILDFSKLESNNLKIDKYEFITTNEFENEIEVFKNSFNKKNIEILVYIDPRLNYSVLGDSLRIRQVMNNLISNAIKFTPKNGYILIEIIQEQISKDKTLISFSITDSGIGIKEDTLSSIFEPFKQADASTTRQYGGTGLGLPISNNILALMGGELKVSSKIGRGSRFYFKIELELILHKKLSDPFHLFKNKKISIYLDDKNDLFQELILIRYIDYFSGNFQTYVDINKLLSSNSDVIVCSKNSLEKNEKLEELIRLNLNIPIIYILNYKNDKINNAINIAQPVTGSKLFKALDNIFNKKNKPEDLLLKTSLDKIGFDIQVLVAEDNHANQKLMKLMLKEMGVNVEIAENGIEAFTMFKRGGWDIIFMDINMPILDGIGALKKILAFEKKNNLRHTPIIALTAKAIKGDKEEFIFAGMDNYISKPVYADKIREIISFYVEKLLPDFIKNKEKKYDIDLVATSLGINKEIVLKIIDEFKKSSSQHIIDLKLAFENNDIEMMSKIAHKFRGATLNLRFNQLSDHLEKIENKKDNNEKIDYKKYIELIKKEINIIKEDF